MALKALQVIAFDTHRVIRLATVVASMRDRIEIELIVALKALFCISSHAISVKIKRVPQVALRCHITRVPSGLALANSWLYTITMGSTLIFTDRLVTYPSIPALVTFTNIRRNRFTMQARRVTDRNVTSLAFIAVKALTILGCRTYAELTFCTPTNITDLALPTIFT